MTAAEKRVFPQPDIVIERLGPCDNCGRDLWSRNGAGRWTIALERETGPPIMEAHYWLINCGGAS